LDRLQERFRGMYQGVVLDMGGRDRGRFKKPRDRVERWIFADINPEHQPDLVLDVSDMRGKVADRSLDVVNAMELFEHVERIDRGLEECFRVLKPEGRLLISVPFLYPVHADPFDFQRGPRGDGRFLLGVRRRGQDPGSRPSPGAVPVLPALLPPAGPVRAAGPDGVRPSPPQARRVSRGVLHRRQEREGKKIRGKEEGEERRAAGGLLRVSSPRPDLERRAI
jgi:SAM-dependent methyltransferase